MSAMPIPGLHFQHDPEMFFTPVEQKLVRRVPTNSSFPQIDGFHTDEAVDTHKAITRSDNGDLIGVVGKDYKALPLLDVLQQLEDAIAPHTNGIPPIIKDKQSHGGAWQSVSYRFPGIKAQIYMPTKGRTTDIDFEVTLKHTYNGSASEVLLYGGVDLVCMNGLIAGRFESFIKRHTKGLTAEAFGDKMDEAIAKFWKKVDIWQAWSNKTITLEQAREFLKVAPGISERRAEKLEKRVQQEFADRGNSVYALYSALTWMASHNTPEFAVRNTGRDNVAETLLNRQETVAQLVNSVDFRALAA